MPYHTEHPRNSASYEPSTQDCADIDRAVLAWELERLTMDPVVRAKKDNCRWWKVGVGNIGAMTKWVVRPSKVMGR
jgi:hypothetical protein